MLFFLSGLGLGKTGMGMVGERSLAEKPDREDWWSEEK
jgi:hypothetical protein